MIRVSRLGPAVVIELIPETGRIEALPDKAEEIAAAIVKAAKDQLNGQTLVFDLQIVVE